MPKTLFLHIGHFKTGTTALQSFLANNPKFLAKHNLSYAQDYQNLGKHSIYAFSLYKAAGVTSLMHGYNKPVTPEKLWQGLFESVRQNTAGATIISSEELMRLGNFPDAVERLKKITKTHAQDLDIRVIAYLRPTDSHLRSWYNQLVKMGVRVPDFNTTVAEVIEPIHYDYGLALKPWAEIFGPGALIVRPYDEASRNDDSLYQDFLSIFGVDLPERGVELPMLDPNPRMDDRVLELVRMMRNAGLPKDVIEWTVLRSQKFNEADLAGLDPVQFQGFKAVQAQAANGLETLRSFVPDESLDLDQYTAHLPTPEPQETLNGWQMTGVLLNELHALRQRMAKENAGIHERIRKLEQQLDAISEQGK